MHTDEENVLVNNPALLAQINTPECTVLLNTASTHVGTVLFGAEDVEVCKFADAVFKVSSYLANTTGVGLEIGKDDIKASIVHHLNQPTIVAGVHYHLPNGASLNNGKGVRLTNAFKDHYMSVAANNGVGSLSVAYQLITNLCAAVAPNKNAKQKARGAYTQLYTACVLPGDDTEGGMTGQLLVHRGVDNTKANRRGVTVAPAFSPLMQAKSQVMVLEAQQISQLNPGATMGECVTAVVKNAKDTSFMLHKDINGNVINDPAVQRTLHFNHAGNAIAPAPPAAPAPAPALLQ